jgi:predicted DNA-binding protein
LKTPSAVVEEVFNRGTEEIEDHYVVVDLYAVPPDVGDAH